MKKEQTFHQVGCISVKSQSWRKRRCQ